MSQLTSLAVRQTHQHLARLYLNEPTNLFGCEKDSLTSYEASSEMSQLTCLAVAHTHYVL
jgi:hypothetical protein